MKINIPTGNPHYNEYRQRNELLKKITVEEYYLPNVGVPISVIVSTVQEKARWVLYGLFNYLSEKTLDEFDDYR